MEWYRLPQEKVKEILERRISLYSLPFSSPSLIFIVVFNNAVTWGTYKDIAYMIEVFGVFYLQYIRPQAFFLSLSHQFFLIDHQVNKMVQFYKSDEIG